MYKQKRLTSASARNQLVPRRHDRERHGSRPRWEQHETAVSDVGEGRFRRWLRGADGGGRRADEDTAAALLQDVQVIVTSPRLTFAADGRRRALSGRRQLSQRRRSGGTGAVKTALHQRAHRSSRRTRDPSPPPPLRRLPGYLLRRLHLQLGHSHEVQRHQERAPQCTQQPAQKG